MNRNGVSDGSKSFTYHIDNTIMDYSKYFTLLCGGKENAAKEWRIDNDKQGHMGCGPSGTSGLEWWSAGPNDKKDWNVYDSRLTFSTTGSVSGGSYKFNPGESGQIYVNKDVAAFGGAQGQTDDFCVDAPEQTVDFEFDVQGEDLFLVFPEHTYFPYIANDDIWNTPRYRVESITGSEINLVIDNGGIAWHYILTSGAAAVQFSGFKYDSEFNLWKTVDDNDDYTTHFWYAPGWSQIADPGFAKSGNEYTFTLPEATSDQWMAQCPIKPNNLHLSADKKYDFSCIISSSEDLPGVTVKLTDVNSGDNYVFVERVPVKAYEDYVFYLSDVNNLSSDADCELFFDFGGNPANTTVTVKKIVVKDHANDDGTVLPSDEPGEDPNKPEGDWTGANLLANMPVEITQWYAPGWSQIADAEYTAENGKYTITYPEAADAQWMAQFTFNNTGIQIQPGKLYDFRCKLVSSNDHPGVTIKLTQQDNDDLYLTADRHAVKAYEETWVELIGIQLNKDEAITNLKMPFDFGGVAAGTEITISDMHLQEHKAAATMNYEDEDNLWKAVDSGEAFLSVTPWFANDGWGQIADPEWSHDGNSWDLVLTDGMGGSQWQGQFPINTTLTAAQADTYNFSCTIEMDNDAPGVTIKLTETDDASKHDDNFFFADRHEIKAYTPYVYTVKGVQLPKNDAHALSLFFDFGGTPAGTNVKISNIIFKKN